MGAFYAYNIRNERVTYQHLLFIRDGCISSSGPQNNNKVQALTELLNLMKWFVGNLTDQTEGANGVKVERRCGRFICVSVKGSTFPEKRRVDDAS